MITRIMLNLYMESILKVLKQLPNVLNPNNFGKTNQKWLLLLNKLVLLANFTDVQVFWSLFIAFHMCNDCAFQFTA